jgi:cellulose biosynthesis protein BcsQ
MSRKPLVFSAGPTSAPEPFSNVIVNANGKGGTGKTSTPANVGGLLAQAGFRILLVDLDPQANLIRDLGMERGNGTEFFNALTTASAAPVISGVRPNLDVVPGGRGMSAAAMYFAKTSPTALTEALHASLAPIVANYDYVFVDTSPGEDELVRAAMQVARAVIILTTPDEAALDGVETTALRIAAARQSNPTLQLAGVVLFNIASRSRRVERLTRDTLEEMLDGEDAPVFRRRIRHLESAALLARRQGKLAHELEANTTKATQAKIEALRTGGNVDPDTAMASSAVAGLAEDYAALAKEILIRIRDLQGVA